MKKILGLDLGTNSIGWALVTTDFKTKIGNINGIGSRIIPMPQDVLGKFDSGVSISQTAERTGYRGVRRIHERKLLRRERIHRILNLINFLPNHYADAIDFEKRYGKFKDKIEVKLNYSIDKNGKNQFLFLQSFNEMVNDFKAIGYENNIPYDWTIFYLRNKALTQKIQKEELAWILLNFNQKRGYYQLRGEEIEEDKTKKEEFHSLKVVDVIEKEKGKNGIWYNVVLENGWVYRRESKSSLSNWIGKEREFIVTTKLNEDGSFKKNTENEIERSFRSPKDDDWGLLKIKTEQTINQSGQTVGTFIYKTLLENPSQKINGKLIRTIERNFYKNELKQILDNQIQFHDELNNSELYHKAINELYKNNVAHKNNIKSRGFNYLFLEDILFYQRPLKSKVSLISNCPLEFRSFIKDGVLEKQPISCIAKSHPLFQEFRLWQWIQNLKIFKRETLNDIDVTHEYLNGEDAYANLFEILNDKKDVTQKQLLALFKLKENSHRWNFVEDKTYPCNETRAIFLSKITKINGMEASFFNEAYSEALWHILYSVTDKIEVESAISKFARKHNLPPEFAKIFATLPPYKNDYGSYSAKAIKKILPLVRKGKFWNEEKIDTYTKSRIDKIITGEFDKNIANRVREKAIDLTEISHFSGLPLWLATYVIYDKHSESKDIEKWKSPEDIGYFLKNEFKQHSLRNPIVEKVITETLRTVKDIWQQYGDGKPDFFSEIHIELGREMKNPAAKRKQMTEQISANENTNIRIKAILEELKNNGVKEVRPYSFSQQDILKIYEEGIYSIENRKDEIETIDKIRKNSKPSNSEIQRYKLWLEQGYISPYTGATIRLSELFTTKYEIEHIFPQSRYFDDSISNKVICESEVNGLKGNLTALEFIKKHKGEKVALNGGGFVQIKEVDDYEEHVKHFYAKNKNKIKNLLSEEIPESFISRQMNDSRYISKVVKSYLSKIVREQTNGEIEQEETSKNVIPITGSITSQMKQDWGLNDIWNEIITPRFERLNEITDSNDFGQWESKAGKKIFQTSVPDTIAKGFSKKRIDHRHHALDALVIACVTRTHVNYLNNLNAKDENDKTVKHELRNTICFKTKPDEKGNYKWLFHKPWEDFTQEVRDKLQKTVVSFKQNTRIINKTVNKYEKFVEGKKSTLTQNKGENWAIRKPMHAETVSGKVILKRIKPSLVPITSMVENIDLIVDINIKKQLKEVAKSFKGDLIGLKKYLKSNPLKIENNPIDRIQIYETIIATATRKNIDISFDEKRIEKITDTGIQKILMSHLNNYNNILDEKGKEIPPHELAFTQEGIEAMNKNIQSLNDGKWHQPILKVRIYEEGSRFEVGQKGNKKAKFVESAKGTNLFFAIYVDETGKRNYKTIPLNEAIERHKQKIGVAPEKDENGNQLLFTLSPNDLVYLPTEEERMEPNLMNFEKLDKVQVDRIYKMVSFTGISAFFIIQNMATSIADKIEFSALNKMEKSIDGIMIKSVCWKLECNRLGKIVKIFK
jgi:CRISPR-associated endonuclease Csn1